MSEMKNAIDSNKRKIEFTRPSLSQANEIELRLKSCKKFDLRDRSIFARNLGDMISSEIRKDDSLTMHKIFQKAFGNSAESMYKKRKSLITLPKETAEPKKLRSKARDYLEILTTISEIKCQYSEEQLTSLRQKFILQLVEGSSFDDQRKIKDRMYENSMGYLKDALNKIADKVLANVDLDYQYAWYVNSFPAAAPSFENLIHNTTAPSIKIADVMKKIDVDSCAFITIPKEEYESLGQGDDIAKLIKKNLFDKYSEIKIDLEEEDLFFFDEFPEDFNDVETAFPGLEFKKDISLNYLKKSSVYLELRYDQWTDRWHIIPSWKAIEDSDNVSTPFLKSEFDDFYGDDYWASYFERYKLGDPQQLLIIFHGYDTEIFSAAEYGIDDEGNHIYALFFTSNQNGFLGRSENNFRGMRFHIPWHSYEVEISFQDTLDFLMASPSYENENNYQIIYKIEGVNNSYKHNSFFSPAPYQSFADNILTNLAYASEENRIDTLLLKDAKEKFQAFKNYEKDCNKKYFDSLACFDKQLKS